jgi:hypothetical protein
MPIEPVDEPERERIRHALKRYKELHGGIGDPLLCERIEEATKLPVKLSTLQRFLKGRHRTDDIAVHRLRKFLTMVAPPPSEDELGRALGNFLPFLLQPADWQTAFAGGYGTLIRPYRPEQESSVVRVGQVGTRQFMRGTTFAPWSAIRLDIPADASYLRVTERLFDPEQRHVDAKDSWQGNAGTFVAISATEYMMFVRSFLDARVYLLTKCSDKPLTLRGIVFQSTDALFFDLSDRQPVSEIEMRRVPDSLRDQYLTNAHNT